MHRRMIIGALAAIALSGCDAGAGARTGITEVTEDSKAPATGMASAATYRGSWGAAKPKYSLLGKMTILSPYRETVRDAYAFNVMGDGELAATGAFVYETDLLSGPIKVGGNVTCMTVVDGGKARLGGVVTYSNSPAMPVGHPLTWSVTDNGPGNHVDTGSSFLGADPELYCRYGLAYPENNGEKNGYIALTEPR